MLNANSVKRTFEPRFRAVLYQEPKRFDRINPRSEVVPAAPIMDGKAGFVRRVVYDEQKVVTLDLLSQATHNGSPEWHRPARGDCLGRARRTGRCVELEYGLDAHQDSRTPEEVKSIFPRESDGLEFPERLP